MARVLAPSSKIIFCEGRPESLDDLLLGHIVPLGQVLVQPVGGKYGLRAFIEGYLGSYRGAQPHYVGFRDRDFDVEPPERSELIRLPGEKPIWLSYRAAIENYLIDADLLWQYWTERENTPRWAHGPALSIDEIKAHIQESARELADYQAVRWALAKLKPGPRWPNVRTTWTRGSGFIPSSLDYGNCLDQARQLVTSLQDQIRDVQPDRLQEYARTYRQQFDDDHFWKDDGYLVWFHGKDHLVELCRRLGPNFPRRHYADWAAEHVDVRKHPDLQQLVEQIKNDGDS
jgi:hypothetical protein